MHKKLHFFHTEDSLQEYYIFKKYLSSPFNSGFHTPITKWPNQKRIQSGLVYRPQTSSKFMTTRQSKRIIWSMADGSPIPGMSDRSSTQDQSDGTQCIVREYTLEEIRTLSRDLMLKHRINDELGHLAFHPIFELPERNPMEPRLVGLAKNSSYNRKFLKTDRKNMLVIDLKTERFEMHEVVSRFLADDLTPSANEQRTTWVIHLFCSNRSGSQNLGPVGIVVLMLHFISTKLTSKTHTKTHQWGFFKVEHEPTTIRGENNDYQKIMEILKALISRILEMCPGHAVHFIFSGIMIGRDYPEKTLRNMARFLIDMERILEYVDPPEAQRMVKCVLSGAGLLHPEYLIPYLEWEKKRDIDTRGEKTEDKYQRMLMLTWNQRDYIELRWDR